MLAITLEGCIVIQLLPGHSKLESTVRCLGTEVDDASEDLRADRDLTLKRLLTEHPNATGGRLRSLCRESATGQERPVVIRSR
ncbi:MAG: hypothetical protein EKK49_02080 [Rhodocyclaceae bacterium]|nr:MAG: hypothetical protein EKK49_02080 [Rhodocyclaceae bacterium]